MFRPSIRGGITKTNPSRGRGRGGRGLRYESNGRIPGGRGRGRIVNGSKGKEGTKPKTMITSSSTRGGRGRGRGGRGRGKALDKEKKNVTKEDLDKEMDSYMLKDAEKGKDLLDTELDEYMSHRGVPVTTIEDKETHHDE